jgi:NAD(P)-dependent dehydrogenase (short-subunit alcohol dehydrogenase family)
MPALQALSESLAREVTPFNIRVLLVELGAFRTNFLSVFVIPTAGLAKAYENTPLDATLQRLRDRNGNHPGDPIKGAARVVDVVMGTRGGKGKPVCSRYR